MISLQCPYKQYILACDRTWHILTHWIHKTEDDLRHYLQNYMLQQKEWFLSVSKSYLDIMQISVEDYIDNIGQSGSQLDIFGLFVFTRLYQFHFGVFYDQGVWCKAADKDFNKTSMMLIL